MGEMLIKLDDATLLALKARADRSGLNVEAVATGLILAGLSTVSDRVSGARAILARSRPSPLSSVEMLDQIRDEGR